MAIVDVPSPTPSAIGRSIEIANARARISTPTQLAWARFKRNKPGVIGGVLVFLFLFVAIAAPYIAPYAYDKVNVSKANRSPGQDPAYVLGTDDRGRDFLSRLIYGARTSLQVAAGVQLITLLLALSLGFAAAWFGGVADFIINRVIEVFTAIPQLLFWLLLILVLGGGIINVIIAIALLSWMETARLVRAQVLSYKEREFVEAARSLGVPTLAIAVRHILPNILNSLIIAVTFSLPAAILAEATLSFFGLGINDPIPSWGKMVGVATNFASRLQQYWHLGLLPAACLCVVVLGFSLFGDALRDALDPRTTH